jgi:hypothetical protein
MPNLADELSLYLCVFGRLNRHRIARLYRRLGWAVTKRGWAEYEITSPFAELELQAESPILLHGAVNDIASVERVLAPLRESGAFYSGECYDQSGKLLEEYKWSGPASVPG